MLLEQIHSPEQLKTLPRHQLPQLAQEIRQFLIEKLSVTGGHLAPNLGVVELTLALHIIFDSPKDKIIWDVGHQSYVHKIITGRKEQFDTLRQFRGLSGFPRRSESVHDVWETGHSSTSLSAALGMAVARDLKRENHEVIAVIGDGALTGGMALEALNHIGHEKRKLIVVLNDNEMSISPNVGALHHYLGRLRTDKHYARVKDELEYFLKRVPAIGETLAKTAERLKDSLKYLVLDGILFEELGLTYLGPVNGHSLDELFSSLQQAKRLNEPVLVHVVTVKGKGYGPAEKDSVKYHGISPYKIESGEVMKTSAAPSYSSVMSRTLIQLAEEDPTIVAVTAAMPGGTGLDQFAAVFPERFFDVGIAEQHATTFCGGLATQGFKPVFAVYSTFLQRAYDQVIHDICRQNLHVVFMVDRAGLVGADGDTHQGVFDLAFLRVVPNMTLMMPRDENQLRHMVYTALYHCEGPVAVRYPRGNAQGLVPEQPRAIPIGKAEILQHGKKVAILAIGPMVEVALQAAELLRPYGVEPTVVDARFIKPLDEELLSRLPGEHELIVTIEEAARAAGFGSAVLEWYADQNIHVQIENIGLPDRFIEHGSIAQLRQSVQLTADECVLRIKRLLFQQKPDLWHA
ncbi:MAG: 1-deoxy-D-xylulose-5-phosphate synthase [Bacillus thermozeamaize]|jgi:1-deoxy-D-xylulose-5-phosphate synthase|uniref:1-deoxy-D-xylulose-5-phosphate synthase n=1 Tax=Bacillus thermozeamaize TaxID=230954 RepID=A0A1Y3PBV6_9BACI|nr:MAG: 1-deoxy-D-xylulose-5-phosphate synthase [Bacillus thermozeamaize]